MGAESLRLASHLKEAGLSNYVRVVKVFVCLTAFVLSCWLLSSSPSQPQSQTKIFGRYSMLSFTLLGVLFYLLVWCVFFALSKEPIHRKRAKVALTSATLLVLIGLFELPAALGFVDYRRIISPPQSFLVINVKPWDNPGNVLDQELIYLHRPGQRIAGETTGDLVNWLGISTDRRYRVDVQYDSRGFRNDHEINRASVVILGDSFVEGVLVPQKDLLSSRLKMLLGSEVANLGQSGYGPQQELVVLRRFGFALKPKTILWLFFEGNDLLDVPRYERFIAQRASIEKERYGFAQRSFLRNVLYTFAGFTAPRLNSDGMEARRRSGQFSRGQGNAETIYFAYPASPLSKEELESLDKARNCFLQAQTLSAENGAQLVFVYVPTKFRVYKSFCDFPNDGYGKLWQLNDLPRQMEEWCKQNGIAYLDLTPALKEAASQGELVYFPDDGHWNEKGHQVVAEAIANFLNLGIK